MSRTRYECMTSDEAFRRVREMDNGWAVAYDPIFTPLFTAAFTSAGLSAGAAATAAAVTTAIATTPVSEGVNRK